MMFERLSGSSNSLDKIPGSVITMASKLTARISLERPQAGVNLIQFQLNDFMVAALFCVNLTGRRGWDYLTTDEGEGRLPSPPRSVMPAKKPPKARRTKAEQRAAAIQQILDVSEELFSVHGFSGVTIKDVAEKIGVHSALILYYFDGKQGLFDAVWERRIQGTAIARAKALDAYEAEAGDHPTVEGALTAYYGSAFDDFIDGGDGLRNFGRLFAQINNAPGFGAEKMQMAFDPVVRRLIEILEKALPGVDRRDIFWGFQFTSGAYTQSLARTGRIDRLSDGLCTSDDLAAVRERMPEFMAAGFEALRNRKQGAISSRDKDKGGKRSRTKVLKQTKQKHLAPPTH